MGAVMETRLVVEETPDGTHTGRSKDNDGSHTGNIFNEKNRLVGQAKYRPPTKDELVDCAREYRLDTQYSVYYSEKEAPKKSFTEVLRESVGRAIGEVLEELVEAGIDMAINKADELITEKVVPWWKERRKNSAACKDDKSGIVQAPTSINGFADHDERDEENQLLIYLEDGARQFQMTREEYDQCIQMANCIKYIVANTTIVEEKTQQVARIEEAGMFSELPSPQKQSAAMLEVLDAIKQEPGFLNGISKDSDANGS